MRKYEDSLKYEIPKKYSAGKSVSVLFEEYSIPRSTIYYWIKRYGKIKVGDGKTVTANDYYLLKKRFNKLKIDFEILRECGSSMDAPMRAKLDLISKLDGKYTIYALCRVLDVRRSNYYH